MFYVEGIRGLIFTMFTHKKLEIVFVFVQRSGSGNLLMDFLAFIEQTWKEGVSNRRNGVTSNGVTA